MDKLAIIERIKNMLGDLSKTKGQAYVAEKVGIDQGSLSKLFSGKKKSVNAETLLGALDALGFQLVAPDEKQTAREVCFVDAKIVSAGEGAPPPQAEKLRGRSPGRSGHEGYPKKSAKK